MSMQLSNFSIHASAKEATHLFCLCYNIINFQSTPPRRRRRYRGQSAGKAKFFNPRLREGGDSDFFGKDITPHVFSIHASAKEATVMMMHYSLRNLRFQSTPPRRRRRDTFIKFSLFHFFNPRLREGGDNLKTGMWHCFTIFNPRLREGGDSQYINGSHKPSVFNPRLREGGDKKWIRKSWIP